tara:strand:+ start:429 stop:713 length:285 start_codon:yes stop_codon:yes gene_type:complete
MVDLNPYFRKKLGETLVFNNEHEKYLMEVISITDTPNAVYLEISSMPHQRDEHGWAYHGVVEADLNPLQSVRSVKETVVLCLKNPDEVTKARKV